LRVDSAKVVDTATTVSGFQQGIFIEYPYLRAGRTYLLTVSATGSVDHRADTTVFQGSATYAPTRASSTIPMTYVGPTDLQ
jgi:hypothetical protein